MTLTKAKKQSLPPQWFFLGLDNFYVSVSLSKVHIKEQQTIHGFKASTSESATNMCKGSDVLVWSLLP